jgi:hypothetical protein
MPLTEHYILFVAKSQTPYLFFFFAATGLALFVDFNS